jgi:hypothetical protein
MQLMTEGIQTSAKLNAADLFVARQFKGVWAIHEGVRDYFRDEFCRMVCV